MFYKIILYILYIYMLRLEVWTVFKVKPQKGEFIFKVLLVFYYFCYKKKKETMNTYLVHCLFFIGWVYKWSNRDHNLNVEII